MADINVERKSGLGWLWWVLGLIVLALIVWLLAAPGDDVEEVAVVDPAPMVTPAMTPEPVAATGAASIAEVLANPAMYVGTDWAGGEVTVAEVPTDRGFWIESQGQRLFAIIVDAPAEAPLDINQGQQLRISEGMLRDASSIGDLPGVPLDVDTQRIIEAQPIFLVVNEDQIEILQR